MVGFNRAGDPHPPIEAECVCVDLTADDSVEAGLVRVRYAYGDRLASLLPLAAYYDFSGAPSPQYEAITVQGTRHLLDALQGFDVEQLVFSSTMLVHRPARVGQRIDEQWPTLRIPRALAKAGAWLQDRMPIGGDPFLKPWMVDRTPDHYALDTTSAAKLLGWRAKRSLRNCHPGDRRRAEGRPVSWYRANGLTPLRRGE